MNLRKHIKQVLKEEMSSDLKKPFMKYEKLINKLVYEVFDEGICGFDWEVVQLHEREGLSMRIVLHFTKNSYKEFDYQRYADAKQELKVWFEDYLPKFNGIFIAYDTTKCNDTHKEEETEGVGGYAAPAFEMKPDHVHFKHLYNESELTERCWKGYTQKGMKTMFGKRYPNCVKIKKKKSLRESIKNALDEQVTKKYSKPNEKVDKLVYRWLDNYFDGSQINKYESWKYYSFGFNFCKNGREIANLHVRFDDKSPNFGPKDKRPTSERSVDEVTLNIYPDMISELLVDIPIRKNYLLYLIEEWFEDTKLDEIQQGFNRNDLSLDDVNVLDHKKRGDICVPPIPKPENITDQEMMDYIKKNTLYTYKMMEENEEEEPGWIEQLYLGILHRKEEERLNQEDNEGTLREEVEVSKTSSLKDSIKEIINDEGVTAATELFGGMSNLIKTVYKGDIKEFSKDTGTKLAWISIDGTRMFIHEVLINELGLEDTPWLSRPEKKLGDFKFGPKNGTQYKFTSRVAPITINGQPYYKVVGTSGDSGFGYGFISPKNQLGKRYRGQIFQQIIDKYNLQEYM